ncbi:MAG: hypothetical protein UZ18_ATM001002559 [Armatimonadetes bacterium OLB18]|nr:MAG: hypothetical protein UZ18_ATM001002559 [Armatimonadetes bacterium OLB18]
MVALLIATSVLLVRNHAVPQVSGGHAGDIGLVSPELLTSVQLGPSPLESIVVELSRISSRTLRVSPDLKREVVGIQARGITLDDVLSRLARVCEAEWEDQGSFLYLRRTPDRQKEIERRDIAQRAKQISEYLSELSQGLSSFGTAYERAREAVRRFELMLRGKDKGVWSSDATGALELFLPSEVLLKRVLIATGSDRLAALPYLETVVLSSNPTPRQSTFPAKIDSILREYAEEQAWFVAAAAEGRFSEEHPLFTSWWKSLQSQPTDFESIGKVILSCRNEGSRIWCLLQVFDRKGELRATATRLLPLPVEAVEANAAEEVPGSIVFRPGGTCAEVVRLLAVADLFSLSTPRSPGPHVVSQALLNSCSSPDRADPIAVLLGGLLEFTEAELGQPVIARLPDSCVTIVSQIGEKQGVPLRSLLRFLVDRHGVRIENASGWLQIFPHNSVACERDRLDRNSLKRIVVSGMEQSRVTLRDAALLYYQGNTGAFRNPIIAAYLNILANGQVKVPPLDLPYPLFSLLGSLSEQEWRRLIDGESLAMSAKSTSSKWFFEQWCSHGAGFDSWLGPGVTQRTALGIASAVPDLLLLGTEAMPSGCGEETWLQLQFGRTWSLQLSEHPPESAMLVPAEIEFSVENLARLCFNVILEGIAERVSEVLKGSWRVSQGVKLTITGRESRFVEIVRDCLFASDESADVTECTFAEFPDELRRRIEDRVNDLLKAAGRPIPPLN